MFVTRLSTLVALGPLLAMADTPKVYPTPREMKFSGGMLTLSPVARIGAAETTDSESIALLRARLSQLKNPGVINEIRVGKRGDASVKAFEKDIPAVSGGYRLIAKDNGLVIAGHDDRGIFYAMQTLRQLCDADGNPADLPAVEITDAPDVPFRGVVEGFYGNPWTHENRLAQFAFYGRHKLDTYIYGPKDDPYHSSPNWRKPYPEKEAARIRELVTVARANKVDFVWAIHPGKDIKWTPADYDAVKGKFQAMYDLGVRSFAVFFDDIGGEGTNPAKQADLMNWLNREFVKPKGDVTPLILCPTEYNKSWANPKPGTYLDILGDTLDPSIHVMWTGDRVIADMNPNALDWINKRIKRKAYIWWNFPVSDYVRNHLLMGPVYGNTSDVGDSMSGFVSNPMERAEASKIALYGVAGYAWNVKAFDSQSAWLEGIREVMPRAPEAFLTFCSHNSDLGPNTHGYRRDESVAIRPVAEAFLTSFREGKPDKDAATKLHEEFKRIADAPATLRAKADNPRLIEEISPWLDAFEQLGLAGQAAMEVAMAGDKQAAWAAYSRGAAALDRLAEIDRTSNRNPNQPGIKTGSLVLEPLITEVFKTSAAKILASISGRPVATIRPITNSNTKDGLEKMTDSDPVTHYYSQQVQKVDDWFGLDLGAEIPVSKVVVVMGRKDGDHDIVHKGQLETTVDGKTWSPLGGETAGERVGWEGRPVIAKQIRYRVTRAGKLDGSKDDVWCAFRTFQVNPTQEAPKIHTTLKNLAAVPVRVEGDSSQLTPQLEVFAFPPGQEISLVFPAVVGITKLEIDLSAPGISNWATLETTEDGNVWREVKLSKKGETALEGTVDLKARAVRLKNTGREKRDAKLAAFKVTTAASSGIATPFTDGRLETSALVGIKQIIEIPADSSGVTLLFTTGTGKGVKVAACAVRDGAVQSVGTTSGDVAEFPLSPAARFLVLTSDSPTARLHEAVWRRKK